MALYREHRPRVTSVPGDPEPIRVSFGDVTLCLTETEAYWLEANVGRVRRDLERERAPHGYCSRCGEAIASKPGPYWACEKCAESEPTP